MPSALSRSVYTLSLTVLLATLLIGEDFSSYLKRDARANLPREALLRRQQDVPAVPGVEERAALDAGCSAENCNFLSYGCDHNQTQPNYYGCACSASYLNAYKLCSSNCSHIPPYSLYRDFCISNGWFNQNTINGTQQNVGGGNGTNNKPGSAWGYPTRGCMTNECRTCIQACDPGVLSYDEVIACTCNSTFITLLDACYKSCPETAESPTSRQAWCQKLKDDAAAKTITTMTTHSGAPKPRDAHIAIVLQAVIGLLVLFGLGHADLIA